jgi:hypothetical protein
MYPDLNPNVDEMPDYDSHKMNFGSQHRIMLLSEIHTVIFFIDSLIRIWVNTGSWSWIEFLLHRIHTELQLYDILMPRRINISYPYKYNNLGFLTAIRIGIRICIRYAIRSSHKLSKIIFNFIICIRTAFQIQTTFFCTLYASFFTQPLTLIRIRKITFSKMGLVNLSTVLLVPVLRIQIRDRCLFDP